MYIYIYIYIYIYKINLRTAAVLLFESLSALFSFAGDKNLEWNIEFDLIG